MQPTHHVFDFAITGEGTRALQRALAQHTGDTPQLPTRLPTRCHRVTP